MSFYRIATVVSVVILSSLSSLASSGAGIVIQKDWIVVISDGNNDLLAGN